jgi:ribosomal protein L27
MANEVFRDEKGRVIGYKTPDNTYLRPSGEVVARIRNGSTYDGKGAVRGKGNQGLRLLGPNKPS